MGTFTNRDIIDKFIQNDGYYGDDPRIWRITEYTSFSGQTCWGVDYYPITRYEETEFVRNPRVIWERKT